MLLSVSYSCSAIQLFFLNKVMFSVSLDQSIVYMIVKPSAKRLSVKVGHNAG